MNVRHLLLFAAVGALLPAVTYAGTCDCSAPAVCESCSDCAPVAECGSCYACESCCNACDTCIPGEMKTVCCHGVSVDVDSLKPEAVSKRLREASQAKLVFVLPDDKPFVYLSGTRMATLGKRREYLVPVGNTTESYDYDIKVDTVFDGQLYHKQHTLDNVRAGAIMKITVAFIPPNADAGLPADITFDPVVIAAGGSDYDN
jgi:hypothetical protein